MNCLPKPLRNWISSRHGVSVHTANGHQVPAEPVVLAEVEPPRPPCVVMVCRWYEESGVLVCRWTRLDEVQPRGPVREQAAASRVLPDLPRSVLSRQGPDDPAHSPGGG